MITVADLRTVVSQSYTRPLRRLADNFLQSRKLQHKRSHAYLNNTQRAKPHEKLEDVIMVLHYAQADMLDWYTLPFHFTRASHGDDWNYYYTFLTMIRAQTVGAMIIPYRIHVYTGDYGVRVGPLIPLAQLRFSHESDAIMMRMALGDLADSTIWGDGSHREGT